MAALGAASIAPPIPMGGPCSGGGGSISSGKVVAVVPLPTASSASQQPQWRTASWQVRLHSAPLRAQGGLQGATFHSTEAPVACACPGR